MDAKFLVFIVVLGTLSIASGVLLFILTHGNSAQNVLLKERREAQNGTRTEKEPYPSFPNDYHAAGLLLLPHSGIAEPFEIWFSGTLQLSRIDYYYGNDRTFQRGDIAPFGKLLKYVPMYSDREGAYEGCWTVPGTETRRIVAQTMIPNITWFKYDKTEVYTGVLTTKWTYEYWAYEMLNSQSVWVTKRKPHRPIRYEMKGFDSMMGSYYDHYVFEYVTFEAWNPDLSVFRLPSGITCYNWSISMESSLTLNPMQEFAMFSPDTHLNTDSLYETFKESKHYIPKENKTSIDRKHIFKHNMRYIRSVNRKNTGFKLAPNHFADLSHEEFLEQTDSIIEVDKRNHVGIVDLNKHKTQYVDKAPPIELIPDSLDWRDFGAVSRVRGQGICGSCYAFTAAGATEGAMFLKTSRLVELSAQQILDCSWGLGNHGCKGGHYAPALSWIYMHGVATDTSYGKYLAQEGSCHLNDTYWGGQIDGFSYVPPWNDTALKLALTKHGPIAVSINVRPMSFKFYSRGIYDDQKCNPNATRHTALVVGYGKENNKEYWIVKNSWSQSWGELGYIRVAMKDNTCGITQYPVAALMNTVSFRLPIKEPIVSIVPEIPSSMGRKVAPKNRRKAPVQSKVSRETTKEEETAASKSKPRVAEGIEASGSSGSLIPYNAPNKTTKNAKAIKILTRTIAEDQQAPRVRKNTKRKERPRSYEGMTPATIRWLKAVEAANRASRKESASASNDDVSENSKQDSQERRTIPTKEIHKKSHHRDVMNNKHKEVHTTGTSRHVLAKPQTNNNIAKVLSMHPESMTSLNSGTENFLPGEAHIHQVMQNSLNYLYDRIEKALATGRKTKQP